MSQFEQCDFFCFLEFSTVLLACCVWKNCCVISVTYMYRLDCLRMKLSELVRGSDKCNCFSLWLTISLIFLFKVTNSWDLFRILKII